MALSFPSTPSVGQIHSAGGKGWMWDGTAWTLINSSQPATLPDGGGIEVATAIQPAQVIDSAETTTYDGGSL